MDCGYYVVATLTNGNRVTFRLIGSIYYVSINHFLNAFNQPTKTFHQNDYATRLQIFLMICSIYAEKTGDKIFDFKHATVPTESECEKYFQHVSHRICMLAIQHMEAQLSLDESHAQRSKPHSLSTTDNSPTVPFALWISSLCASLAVNMPLPPPDQQLLSRKDDKPILRLRLNTTKPTPPQPTPPVLPVKKLDKKLQNTTKQKEKIMQKLIADEEREKHKKMKKQNKSKPKQTTTTKKKQKEPTVIECTCLEEEKLFVANNQNYFCQCEGFTEDYYFDI